MQTREPGFHSEWITIGDHRILLASRSAFPTPKMRFLAEVAVETCEAADAKLARVVSVSYDYCRNTKRHTWVVRIASTSKDDEYLAERVTEALQAIYQRDDHLVAALFVDAVPVDIHGYHFDYTHYLSVQAEAIPLDA